MWEQVKWLAQMLSGRDIARAAVLGVALAFTALLEMIALGAVIPFVKLLGDPGYIDHQAVINAVYRFVGSPGAGIFLIYCGLFWALCVIIKNGFQAVVIDAQETLLADKIADVASRLFSNYVRMNWITALRRDTTVMVDTIEQATGWPLVTSFLGVIALYSEGLVTACVVALLVAYEPLITISVSLFLGLSFYLTFLLIKKRVDRLSPQRVAVFNARMKILQESMDALKEIKFYAAEGRFIGKFAEQCQRAGDLARSINILQNFPRMVVEVLVVTGIVLVVALLMLQGRRTDESMVALSLFTVGAFRLMPSLNRIVNALSNLRYTRDTIRIIHEDLALAPAVAGVSDAGPAPVFKAELGVDHLSFHYDAGKPILKEVSLTVRRGRSIAFIGRSGSGKTTLADIILGLLPPSSGSVRVDGVDIYADVQAWRRQVGYVPQAITILDQTLRENIAFGVASEEIDDERVAEAIALSQLKDLVDDLPNGVETVLGDRGVRLSGGQRQRVGIARALYRDPAILVLDEATSALDVGTEKKVSDAIESLRGRCTLIIIAHRLSTVRHCDELLLLHEGRVVGRGTFDDLQESSEEFQRMVQLAELMADDTRNEVTVDA